MKLKENNEQLVISKALKLIFKYSGYQRLYKYQNKEYPLVLQQMWCAGVIKYQKKHIDTPEGTA